MAYCPNISDEQVVREFNSIVEHFGGKPLSIEEFKNSQLRDTRQGIDKTSMDSAYYLWSKYAGNLSQIKQDSNYTKKTTESLLEERSSKYLIKELGAIKQESLTNHLARLITKKIIANPDANINATRNEVLREFKDKFTKIKGELETSNHPQKEAVLNGLINPVLNNFNTVANIVNIKVQKINNLIGEVNDDIDIELTDVQDNEKIANTKISYEEKLSLSAEVKRLFADIDSGSKNIVGENEVMDYNVVDNVVKSIVANIEPDFDIMMQALLDNVVAHPWLNQLVNKLKNSDARIQNLFVSEMNMHYVEHYMVLWRKDKTGFYLSLELANESSAADNIFKDWTGNLVTSENVDAEGMLTNKQDLLDRYKSFTEKDAKPDEKEVRKWLEDVGVYLDDKLWNSIVKSNYKLGKNEVSFDSFIKTGPMKYINSRIKTSGAKSIEEYSILDAYSVKNLAKAQAKYVGTLSTNSHRAGNKTVYSYGKNKYLVDFVRELKRGNLAEEVLSSGGVFNENSKILNAFKNKDEVFIQNFKIAVASLQSIKKIGAQNKDNMELHNLNEDEYEMHDIGRLHSPQEDVTGNAKRVGLFNFLTTSDKSTAMQVKMLCEDIKLNKNGDLSQESLDRIYDQLVLPEIRRIKQYENLKKTNTPFPNNEFELGGHMFLILSSLNNLQGMWNEDGSININVEDVNMRTAINEEVKKVVKDLVDSKLELWQKYNFYSTSDKGKVELNMLDTRVLEGQGVLRGLDENSIPRALATDMVFQYLITNANFYTGIVGDPANFFKSITFKNTLSKLIKDNVLTSKQGQDFALVWTKFTNEQRIKTVEEVYDNVGKRLAMYIAPGKSIADYSGEVKYIFVNDRKVNSLALDQYKAILGEDAKEYSSAGTLKEGTNAQEFTTFLEDMLIRFRSGLVSESLYNETKKIVERELSKKTPNHYYFENLKKELPEKELKEFNKLVQQVQKPVYSWFEIDKKSHTGITPMYIKTSSYPLLPELTTGNEIDKIRIMMEKNGIQRLAFPSGTKLGMPTNPATLWNEDGTIKSELTENELKSSIKILPRRGFRLQQEVPYEALKDWINRVSQADKNLFINMLAVEGFEYNGDVYNGYKLQEEYQKNYGELYRLGYNKLVSDLEVKFDENGDISSFNRVKLKEILLEEAVKRDYALNDIEALDLDDALDYIAFMPSASKYEALLNAIVKNRILQMKFKGKSFVLSTEEGYQEDKTKAYEDLKDKSGIVYTDKWTGTLDSGHFEDANGNRLTGEELTKAFKEGTAIVKRPAQVLLPWKFQWKGELLHIEDFTKDDDPTKIDYNKLPQELLEIFGMRIPNQGPNSQSWIEIAGFLPKRSGDIIVATRDYLAQMGSDFDVDKLYTYMYNYYFDGNKLEKINFNSREDILNLKEETLKNLVFQLDNEEFKTLDKQAQYLENVDKVWNQALQNKQLDIHIAIHKNTNLLVQKQILDPLGFWKFKSIADEIASARPVNPTFTAMSDAYQRFKRLNAASGKTLVGDFANLVMFISVAQGKDLYLYNKSNGNRININMGGKWSNGDLSNALTIRTKNKLVNAIHQETKIPKKDIDANIESYMPKILDYLDSKDIVFRSSVANGLLSSAVDNEKEQILDKLFMNSMTSRYVKLLAALGYEEEVGYFVKQPIIVDYFNELSKLRSSLGGFVPNAERLAEEYVLSKYTIKEYSEERYKEKYADGKGLTVNAMKDSILNPTGDFNYIQKSAFEQLKFLKKYADDLQAIQSAINTDSKGLDKNLLETISKENAVDKLYLRSIKNADSILEGTINGFSTDYGLRFNNKLWANLFPYQQQGVEYMFNKVEEILGKDEVGVQGKADLKGKVWKKFKSYLYTLNDLGLYTDNIDAERERLFMDREGNVSIASKVKKMKNLPEFVNHPFISKLNVDKTTNPSTIKMDANFDQVGELLTVQGAMDLYINSRPIEGLNITTREVFEDLVRASYIAGGIQEAVQYLKFMPVSYMYSIGFTENLSNKVRTKFFEDTEKLMIPDKEAPYWMLPPFIVQYFQHDTRGISSLGKDYTKSIVIKNLNKNLTTDIKVTEFSLINDDFRVTRDTKQVPPEFLVIPSSRKRGLDSNILFIHQGNLDEKGYPIYHRIPNYGQFSFDEFNYNDEFYNSKISSYNTGGYRFNQPVVSYPEDTSYSESYSNPQTKVVPQEVLELPKQGNVESISKVLSNITLHSDDEFYAELAKEYNKHTDKLGSITINSNNYTDAIAGRYSDTGNIYINLSHEQNSNVDGMSETILHEVTHGFVNNILTTNPSKLSAETRMAVADLTRLHSIYKDRIIQRLGQEKYNEIVANFKKKSNNEISKLVVNNAESMQVYATTSVKEFASMAITNSEVQKDLNTIDDPSAKERGLLDKFVDIVTRLLNSIGINIKKGTLLEGAVQDIIVIIKSNDVQSLEQFEGEVVETMFPGKSNTNEMNSILRENGELNSDGTSKLLIHDKNGSSENYQKMVKRAQKINAKNYPYKAIVANTTGEEVTIRSGRLYYYIKLIPRELDVRQKMNSISQQEIFDRIRKCR